MKRTVRLLLLLVGFCLYVAAGAAFAKDYQGGYYAAYEKSLGDGIRDVYVLPQRVVSTLGFFPPITLAYTPDANGFIFSVYPDGSVGNLRSTTSTWKDVAALGLQPSSYKAFVGDFRGAGIRGLLVQGSGGNHSFVIGAMEASPYIYHDFGDQLNSQQYSLTVGDFNSDSRSDILLKSGGNSYLVPGLGHGRLFDMSALAPVVSGPPAPVVAPSTAACYAGVSNFESVRNADLNTAANQLDNSPEIAALARTLEYSPLAIYEYVYNRIDFEPYKGAEQGALATLKARRGNDIDHASLLIALLRASKIPARYVSGTVLLEDMPSHYYWHKTLNYSGMLYSVAYNGLQITDGNSYVVQGRNAILARHVWVEACIPYENYRGTRVTDSAGRWLPLDASFKRYTPREGVINTTVNFDYAGFLSGRNKRMPLELYIDDLMDAVRVSKPDATPSDLGVSWDKQALDLEFLPDSLPYAVQEFKDWNSASTNSRYSALPDAWVKYSRIVFEGQSVDVPYSAFAGGRVTLSFQDGTVSSTATYLQNATPYANYPDGNWQNVPESLRNSAPQNNFLQQYRASGQAVCTGPAAATPVLKIDGVVKKTFTDRPICLPYAADCETKRVCSSWTTKTWTQCIPSIPTVWHDFNGNVQVIQNPPRCYTYSYPECSGYQVVTTCNDLGWTPLRNTYSLGVRPILNFENQTSNAVNYQKKISPLEYYALQVYTHNQSDEFLGERFRRFSNSIRGNLSPWNNPDEIIGEYLHIVGRKYLRYVDEGNRLAGKLLGETGHMFDATVLTSLRSSISFIYDMPFAMFSDGYLVDAFGITNSSKLAGGQWSEKMLALSGLNGSAYESYIWQENANSDAISTVTGLQIAQEAVKPDPNRPGVEAVRTVSSANELRSFLKTCSGGIGGVIASFISKCYSAATVEGIASWFDDPAGGKITIPREVLDIPGFYGYVYIADRPNSKTYAIAQGKGGYSIPTWNSSYFDMGDYSGTSAFDWSDYDLTTNNDSYSTGWHFDFTNSSTDWSKYSAGDNISLFDFGNYGIEYSATNSLPSGLNSLINTGASDGSIWSGDPVNMVTGNMYHTETDISVAARGLPLIFQRAYNSRDVQQDGPLGPGWTHSFNQSLRFVADSTTATKPTDIVWKTSDGGRRYIKLNPAITLVGGNLNLQPGLATAPKGFSFTLVRPHSMGQPTEFLIKEKSGVEYRFGAVSGALNTEAKLTSITDANGNKITLNYDTAGRLVSVVDADNRLLTFSYDGNQAHIIGVTWAGEQHQYEYSSAGNLITYRNPLDRARQIATTTYSYYSSKEGVNLSPRMKGFSSADGAGMTFEYYPNGKVYRHYNTKGETQVFNFNDYRRESIATDERGNKTQYLFNVNGLPLEITAPDGARTKYLYENAADPMLRSAIIDPLGQKTSYLYDGNGNVTQETLPSGKTNKYFYYNSFGKPQLIKNAADDYRLNLFDTKGNLTDEVVFVKGFGSSATIVPGSFNLTANAANILAWTKKTYDAYGNVAQSRRVRDFANPSTGPAVGYVYADTVNGSNGVVPTQITYSGDIDGDGIVGAGEGLGSYDFTYDRSGRVKTGFDQRLYPVQFTYDAAGRKVKGTDSYGQMRDYNYDAAGHLVNESLTAKTAGMVGALDTNSFGYDELGRLSTQTNAAGAVMKMEYDAAGNLIATTSPDGYVLRYDYDANNRMVGAQDQKGNTVRRVLDATGRIKALIDPNGFQTSYVYYGAAQNGRVRRVTDAEDRWTEFEYDALGQVVRTIGGKGATSATETRSEYDALGRVIRVVKEQYTDSVLGIVRPVTTYTYNSLGYRTMVRAGHTNAAGDKSADQLKTQVTVTYDDFGRVLTSTDALGKISRGLEYDAHGNALRSLDANGNVTTATYGYGGVLLSKLTSGYGPTRHMRVTRNALGQPTRIDSDSVSYTYEYDDAHRVASVTDSRGNKTVAYTYSMGGLLNQICQTANNLHCDGADVTTTYMYDPVGRMTSIRTPDNTAINFSYDAAGRLVEKSYPNLVQEVYEYFKDGRLKSTTLQDRIEHDPLGSTSYTYDEAGRLASQNVDQYGGTVVANSSYLYDGTGRLKSVSSNWYNESVTYDPYGNRRSHTTDISGTAQTYAYEVNDLHQIVNVRQNTLSGMPVMSFSYDANGNMISQANGSTKLDFAYNSWNELTEAKGPGGTESYQYDHNGLRIAKSRGSDVHRYLLTGPDILADYSADWNTVQARFIHGTHMDEPLMMSAGTERFYFHGDSRGSIASATGSLTQQGEVSIQMMAVYSAWGEVGRIGAELPFGYAGREHDASGLVYMRSRYYQPQYGRFTQQDPAGFVDGVNRYTYALNSPVNYVDPWGRMATGPSYTGSSSYLSSWEASPYASGINASNRDSYYGTQRGPQTTGHIDSLAYQYGTYSQWSFSGAQLIMQYDGRSDVKWIQTVTAVGEYQENGIKMDTGVPFIDVHKQGWSNEASPIFYPQILKDRPGVFYDSPGRPVAVDWKAEVSAMVPDKNGGYSPAITISWGFVLSPDGAVQVAPPTKTIPSDFHRDAVGKVK